jgi:hypothetical protein
VLVSGNQKKYILVLRENQWEPARIILEYGEDSFETHVTMDWMGNINVLHKPQDVYVIDKYKLDGTLAETFQLPSVDRRYRAFEIDRLNRVWAVYILYSSDVNPRMGVFEVNKEGTPREIEIYTPENSNFEEDDEKLYMTEDGRLWASDDRLVYIDTNSEVLPFPIPGLEIPFGAVMGILAVLGIVHFFAVESAQDEGWLLDEKPKVVKP